MPLEIAAPIPPELRAADELLTQYGRWARMGRGGARGCGSAERHYRAPAGEVLEARREAVDVGMSTPDAIKCQKALARIPEPERIVLQVLYVPQRCPAHVQFRILRIHPTDSQARHLRGLTMFDYFRQKMERVWG